MTEDEIKKLRENTLPTLSEEEREATRSLIREYLVLCEQIYERKKRDGTWPWPDSTNSES